MARQDDLTSQELDALHEVSKGMMQRVIPVDIRDRLIDLKYIEQKLGGLAITAKGTLYAATHKR